MIVEKPRVFVSGGDGILATALRTHFPDAYFYNRSQCDITSRISLNSVFQEVKPNIVLHCGAITGHNVTPMAYMEANIVGTANIVRQCARWNARLIYPSTDYLGAKHEDDPVKPVNDYAASKLGGELCVRMLPNSLIVRGSWYDKLDYEEAAVDAYTSKVHVSQAAAWIAKLALTDCTGIVNIGGPRQPIFDIVREHKADVRPVLREELTWPIPADASLDTSRFQALGLS